MARPLITLLTDFGVADGFVGVMKGVILSLCPEARIVDLTHDIPPQQVLVGAFVLRSAVPFFPAGTIHLAVVDPGVGTPRRPILVETDLGWLVGPDNGLLSPAAVVAGRPRPRVLTESRFFRHPVSNTFHGRDVFAPVAAHLARGVPAAEFGAAVDSIAAPPVPEAQSSAGVCRGTVVYVDHFGNLVTNISAEALDAFPARRVSVTIAGRRVAGPVAAYGAVPEGTPLAVVGSWGQLEIAVRNGNAARLFAAGPGCRVTVKVESPGE